MFAVGQIDCLGNNIAYATTSPANVACNDTLAVMVGGVPRDPERQKLLPIINKLHGLLAAKLPTLGYTCALYNQPGTGRSEGDLAKETIAFRSATLTELARKLCAMHGLGKVAFIGMSAGSYMALSARAELIHSGFDITSMVLQSPPAFPEDVERIPYGPAFRQRLDDWDFSGSPAFKRLESTAINSTQVYITYFQADSPPIPRPIQNEYLMKVTQLKSAGLPVSFDVIQGVAHNFRRLGAEADSRNVVDNDAIRSSAAKIIEFMS